MKDTLIIAQDNRMLCQFCNNVCNKLHRSRKRRWWWECDKCSTRFLTSLQGKIESISFLSKGKKSIYAIEVDLKKNTSFLLHYKDKMMEVLKTFEDMPENLTPDSFRNKIKTYLMLL